MKIFAILFIFLASFHLHAGCSCSCVNGAMQSLCSGPLDIASPCLGICPMAGPSVAPIETPTIPPIGTSYCHEEQVYNRATSAYEWRKICE